MSRTVCGICMCPYGDQGDCACPTPVTGHSATPESEQDEHTKFSEYLKTTHPTMFTKHASCETGPGWFKIIKLLCKNIDDHVKWKNRQGNLVEPVVVQQIKEKFGGLRFYYQGGDDYVRGLVTMAEEWADQTCETCGDPGIRRSGGWIRTLCDKHK